MARLLRSSQSRADYSEIWDYIAADKLAAADRLIDRFDRALDLLAEHPHTGRPRDDLGPSLRSYPVGSYMIVYRPIEGGIELVRVVHGARDLHRLFDRE